MQHDDDEETVDTGSESDDDQEQKSLEEDDDSTLLANYEESFSNAEDAGMDPNEAYDEAADRTDQ